MIALVVLTGVHRSGPFPTAPVMLWVAALGPAMCVLTSALLLPALRKMRPGHWMAGVGLALPVVQEWAIPAPVGMLAMLGGGEPHLTPTLSGLCTLLGTGVALTNAGLVAGLRPGHPWADGEAGSVEHPARQRTRRLLWVQLGLGIAGLGWLCVAALGAGDGGLGLLWVIALGPVMCVLSSAPLLPAIRRAGPATRGLAVAVLVPVLHEGPAGIVAVALGALGGTPMHVAVALSGLCTALGTAVAVINAGLLAFAPAARAAFSSASATRGGVTAEPLSPLPLPG